MTFIAALADHICQSTLFAAAVGLLALALRKSPARTRHRLWTAASVKFLVPFSLLIGMGSQIAFPWNAASPESRWYIFLNAIGRPFSRGGAPASISPLSEAISVRGIAVLGAIWACGCAAALAAWWRRSHRIAATIRNAEPFTAGREPDVLRRLERIGRIRRPIAMRSSPAFPEPGVFGIFRPVLVWPEGISERLDDAHLEAIVAHEVCHVWRRDNLAFATHLAVEAIFWFHPLVWWLGARLVVERERACDEQVLGSGNEPRTEPRITPRITPRIYAESILIACEFGAGAALSCGSGATGADLEERIVHIMRASSARRVDSRTKLVLAFAGFAAFSAPILLGSLSPCMRAASRHSMSKTAAQTIRPDVTAMRARPGREKEKER
ncbi:MAG: M56 family metallopeptidase [Thermoanaerobaculia bacterium]